MERTTPRCPDCEAADSTIPMDSMTRRELFRAAGGAALTAVAASAAMALPEAKAFAMPRVAPLPQTGAPESVVRTLYNSLNEKQRAAVAMPWTHEKRMMVNANWEIVKPTIADTFNADQQEMIRAILKGVTSDEWYEKFLAQMKNDGGGLEQYHAALFHDDKSGKTEWVLTGRHVTMRCGGDPADNMAFGGPIFYGHAPKDTEDPGHPGNVFWYQAKAANEVFHMLDGKQRDQALIALAPDESAIKFRKPGDPLPGIPIGTLARDQKAHVETVMKDVLAPYRRSDVEDVMRDIKANGGLDAMHLAFYKQDDLGSDGVWDIWRLEGPAIVWHFRGAPHVHTWVNIARKA